MKQLILFLVLISVIFSAVSGGDYYVQQEWTSTSGSLETPSTMPDTAFNTSGSGYSAVIGPLYYDIPEITLQSPTNGTTNGPLSLSCSASDWDWLKTVTFYVGPQGSALSAVATSNISGYQSSASIATTIGVNSVWNCYACDVHGICKWGTNRSVNYYRDPECTDCNQQFLDWTQQQHCPQNEVEIKTLEGTSISIFYKPTAKLISVSTNSSGSATFETIGEGRYEITLVKSGYKTTEGSFNYVNCPIPNKKFTVLDSFSCLNNQVSIFVTNGTAPVSDATVSLNGSIQMTDANGSAKFTIATEGVRLIQISKAGFDSYSDSRTYEFCPSNLMSINWKLNCPDNQVVITVTDRSSGQPISGAAISSYGSTDSDGKLLISVSEPKSFDISVTAEDYESQSTQFLIDKICEKEKEPLKPGENPKPPTTPPAGTPVVPEKPTTTPNIPSTPVSENVLSSSNFEKIKDTLADYIAGTEEKKRLSLIVAIALVIAAVFVYLRFIRPKPKLLEKEK